jgi:hypothetical protein
VAGAGGDRLNASLLKKEMLLQFAKAKIGRFSDIYSVLADGDILE